MYVEVDNNLHRGSVCQSYGFSSNIGSKGRTVLKPTGINDVSDNCISIKKN